jgi:sec-independent protein translocase protein TatA
MPGWPETIFILIVVLLLFGPRKLPELARGLGKSLGEFKKARDEFERELRSVATEVEIKAPGDTQPHQPFPQASQGPAPSESGVAKDRPPEKPA